MSLSDPVVYGSIIAVVLSAVVVIAISFRVVQLMNSDEQNRKK